MELVVYTLVFLFVFLVVYMALFISYHVVRSEYFSKKQKTAIIAIAWVVPVLGPAFILRVLLDDKAIERKHGVPLFDFIFLTAVLTNSSQSNESGVDSQIGSSSESESEW